MAFDAGCWLGTPVSLYVGHSMYFSIWTLWGFLTTWWLGSKGEYPERDSETQRERETYELLRSWPVGWEIYSSCSCLRQASKVFLLVKNATYQPGVGSLFLWSLLALLYTDQFQISPGEVPWSFEPIKGENVSSLKLNSWAFLIHHIHMNIFSATAEPLASGGTPGRRQLALP